MSKRKIPSRKALEEALKENRGNMAQTARVFHCDRSTICHLVNNDPQLRDLVTELADEFLDEAESNFYKHVEDGNLTALIFFLKTQGRHRGWSERLEIMPLTRQDIQIELGTPTAAITDDQTDAIDAVSTTVALLEQ